jgi:RHS repeat-associated protein
MTNSKGRLAEAYTCTGSCTTKITDEGFSYTARGELSDQYQSSQNSGGYYHANYLYWPNGAIRQISGLPTLPTFTYGVDGEGRISTLSASTGQNPLTGTGYNSASLPTTVNFGSGDNDAYTYDPNTGRMTQYQFNVNGQNFVGNLTWNPNGTLASQQTIDPFNSVDTQNCTYAHDDLTRIASANCGSTWMQTFAYDAFGNLFKNGTMSFQPTYSAATNRMTSLPGFTPTYDNNGNVLNNNAHPYTWDADGKYASVDGIGITYDALGRRIEIAYPSEIFYLPDGSSILFKGQVARDGALKLPGGAQAIYDANNGGLIQYEHADHLGSLRLATTPARGYLSSLAYAPFGEQYSAINQGDAEGFTGIGPAFDFDEYDFPARQYSNQGRWVSPDPAGLAAVNPAFPQSWNRYAYVLNTPLIATDPTGLGPCPLAYASSGGCGGGSCTLDGQSIDCSTASSVLQAGFGIQCPGNYCGPYAGNNGLLYQFVATTEGGAYVNPISGDLFTNATEFGLPPIDDSNPFPNSTGQGSSGGGGGCTARILRAVNQTFGTSFTASDVQGTPFDNGGGINLNILGNGLPAGQFNSIQPGRYPLSPLTWFIGYGPTLHVTGRGIFDPTAAFSNSNAGGATSVLFTAHIDTSFLYNPIGAVIHLVRDLLHIGGPRNPCP